MQASSIETPRLLLVLGTEPVLEAVLRGNKSLGKLLGVKVPFGWTEFGYPIFRYSLEMVKENVSKVIWWTYLPVLKKEKVLIGSCGYKGPPDKDGEMEISYEIAKPFRNLGLMLVIAGIQLITIGFVPEMQMRTYYESQQKMPYRVR